MAETTDTAPSQTNPTTRSRRATAATGSARRGNVRATHEQESLEAQVAQLQADLISITTTLGQMGRDAGNELKSTAKARADDLTSRGQSALDAAQDEFGAFEKQIKDTIREKPLTAVAGAVALGFLLAVVTR